MSNTCKPYLCGGVFLTYLMEARKPRAGVRDHYMGDTDGLSDPELLCSLIRVMCPSFIDPPNGTFKQNTSAYKNCNKSNGTYLPFADGSVEVCSFDECVKTNYKNALTRMSEFAEKFLDINTETKKDEYLIRALVEIIDSDGQIPDEAEFYINENGLPTTKKKIISHSHFCFQAFLVGVWHYILLYRKDNMVGRDTIENWKPTYRISSISISYYNSVNAHEYEQPMSEENTEETDETQQPHDSSSGATTQIANNPVVFNQYGNNGIQIGSIGTLTINHNNK